MTAIPAVETTPPPLRRLALPIAAVLFAFLTAIASFGLPSALTAWTASGDELASRTQYVVWGALAGVFLPGALLGLIRRPNLVPARQLAVFAVAAVVTVLLAFETENLEYVGWFTVPVLILLTLHPQRSRLVPSSSPHRGVLALALVATAPALVYAVTQARLSAATSSADTLHGGYLQAGVLALSLLLATGVSAYRDSGWRLTTGCVVVATTMLGVAGVLFPEDPSSVGRPGGAGLLVAAAALTALSVRE